MTPRCRAPATHDSVSFGPCVEGTGLHGAAGCGTRAGADAARFAA